MSGPMENISSTKVIEVPSWIRGYHVYKEYWRIKIDEVLELKHEHDNEQDKNAIAVIKEGDVVGHIPRALASTNHGNGIVRHFLAKSGSEAEAKVIGTAVNRGGGYGMAIPCIYKFMGHEKNIDLLSKLLDIPNNLFVRVEMECGQKRTAEESGRKKKARKR